MKRTGVLSGLVVVGLAASLSLTGCFAAPTITGGGTDGTGQSGQSDGNDAGTTTTDPPAGPDVTDFVGLPDTFPRDEVPIIDGDVVFGLDLGTGWSVIVSTNDLAAAFADASSRLTGAGFEAVVENASAEGSLGVYKNDKYQVQMTASDTNDYGLAVGYVVVILG